MNRAKIKEARYNNVTPLYFTPNNEISSKYPQKWQNKVGALSPISPTYLNLKRLDGATYCFRSNKIEASGAILLGPLSP